MLTALDEKHSAVTERFLVQIRGWGFLLFSFERSEKAVRVDKGKLDLPLLQVLSGGGDLIF